MLSRQLLSIVVLGSLTLGSTLGARAADWPQWRGPQRDGLSAETGLLKKWPAGGPKLLWQQKDIGEGYSTPAVVGDRIYLMGNRGTEDEFVACLAVGDGRELWSTRVGEVGENRGPQYPGARSTPTVDGELLYALGSDGDLVCLETASGKLRWQKNLREDFGGQPGNWAYAESPLVDGEIVLCTPGGKEATLVALDKKSGDTIWKTAIDQGDQAAYASAAIARLDGKKEYVQFLQKGVVGVDAQTGKFLWRYERTAQGSPANIPSPVVLDDLIYTSTGRGGAGLVKLSADGKGVKAEQVYYQGKLPTSIGGAVVVDGLLYGTTGQGLVCADFATGEIKWQDRSIGAAALCYADGRLYLHGENGEAALVLATPEKYQELGRFTPPDQPDRSGRTKAWAYPVVSNGRLYLRDQGFLWSYDVRQ